MCTGFVPLTLTLTSLTHSLPSTPLVRGFWCYLCPTDCHSSRQQPLQWQQDLTKMCLGCGCMRMGEPVLCMLNGCGWVRCVGGVCMSMHLLPTPSPVNAFATFALVAVIVVAIPLYVWLKRRKTAAPVGGTKERGKCFCCSHLTVTHTACSPAGVYLKDLQTEVVYITLCVCECSIRKCIHKCTQQCTSTC